MKTLVSLLCTLFFLVAEFTYSQVNSSTSKKRILVSQSWIIGLGYNFVDDSGGGLRGFLLLESKWNSVPYPSRISFGRYFKSGLGFEAIATVNKFKEGTLVQRVIITEDIPYIGFDARLSYDLNKIIGETAWFDPYLGIGFGYSESNNKGNGTYNIIVGFRLWFSNTWGLDFNSTGKWAMSNQASNHLQHSIGVVYQFGLKRTFRGRTR